MAVTSSDLPTPPKQRGMLVYLLERVILWLMGYPPVRCHYTTQNVRIPIKPGPKPVELAAELLQPILPNGEKPIGTVIQTAPYGRGFAIGVVPRAFAARGYQVLIICVRGTFGSSGEFDPFNNDVEDAKGVLKWMREQPWYTGTFATVGGSYASFTQWSMMEDPPEDMVASLAMVSIHDASRFAWATGALNLDLVRWRELVSTQEMSWFSWKWLTRPKFEPIAQSASLAPDLRKHFGSEERWLNSVVATPDTQDPFYARMKHGKALEVTNIPILILTGWYDLFNEQSVDQYLRLKERGANVAMTSGPWSHITSAISPKVGRETFNWIEEHLGGRAEAKRKSTVEYFVTGAEEWRSVPTYPPPTTPTALYLQNGGTLEAESTSNAVGSSSFTFDPNHATPTIGGRALFQWAAVNDSALAKRKDVLVFETAPLQTDFEFCGRPIIELAHSSSHPFVDIFVRVSEVNHNGKSTNVTEVYKRLDPKRRDDEIVRLVLNSTSHRFVRGRKMRVVIAGGNFPQYQRNSGFEYDGGESGKLRSVKHTIHFGEGKISKIEFPVVKVA